MPKRPWTPYAVLCSTELCFRRLCNFDLPNKQRFSLQRHKSTRIRRSRILGQYAGFLWRDLVLAFGKARRRFSMEGSCIGFWKSKANSTFCKVVKQKGETFWPPLQSVFAFDTGGLGLWLGAFGRSRLYRCQSVPGPPMPVFCGTELCFRRLCNFDLPNKQRFSLQRHKSTRIRLVPNSWDSLL